jgi:hypothetical protein
MDEIELQTTLVWMRRRQGIDLDTGTLADPAAAAAKLSELAQEQSRHLPFGSEPPQFVRLLHDLAPKDVTND